ncbi:MAG: hypothetical protein ACHP84_13940 [Caulobacterales bacterium]
MAKPPNEQPTKQLELSVPAELHAYLTHLAKFTLLGASPNDVARHLLTERCDQLQREGYPPKHPY